MQIQNSLMFNRPCVSLSALRKFFFFKKKMKQFSELESQGSSVSLVWFVVDASAPLESQLEPRSLVSSMPTVFLINKADLVSAEVVTDCG
jgi:ribosome biogenesis GTPase A